MSLQKAKLMRAGSEGQYTAAGREFKYLGVVFTSDGTRRLILLNSLFSDIHLWPWILDNDIKYKRQRWDFHGVEGVILCHNVRSCEIRKTLNVLPLNYRNQEVSATLIRPRDQNVPRKIGEASPDAHTHEKATQRSTKYQVVAWLFLGPCLVPSVWSQQNYLGLLKTARYVESSHGCCFRDHPHWKSRYKNEWTVVIVYCAVRSCK